MEDELQEEVHHKKACDLFHNTRTINNQYNAAHNCTTFAAQMYGLEIVVVCSLPIAGGAVPGLR